MLTIFQEISKSLQENKSLALITIIESNGSTPRTAGTRMIVYADGSLFGTVGGGLYEGEAIFVAKQLLAHTHTQDIPSHNISDSQKALILYYDMVSKQNSTDMDMICGGDLRLLIEIIEPTADNNLLYASLCEKTQSLANFITRISPCSESEKKEFLESKATLKIASTAKETLVYVAHAFLRESSHVNSSKATNYLEINADILSDSLKANLLADLGAERKNIFLQNYEFCFYPINTPYRLHIFGAGHVSLELAQLTHYLDFQTFVLDDRAEFANEDRFGFASSLVLPALDEKNVDTYLNQYNIGEKDGLIIVTRGHARDRDVLISCLKTCAGYLGMIGSRSKRQATYEYLLNNGYKKQDFDRIFSPIGLSIGAQSPQEIAISISAQLIQWRAKCLEKDTRYA